MSARFSADWLEGHRVHLPTIERSSIIGIGHVMGELDSLLARLHQPELARSLGLELPRGILLWGEPGLGKTLVARYLATQLGEGIPFFELGSDELVSPIFENPQTRSAKLPRLTSPGRAAQA
jgi:ATP-dependent 26S proteasome regulatory subunit